MSGCGLEGKLIERPWKLVDFEFKREVAILIGFLKRKRKRSLNVEC
jgi:hypothetical protein